MQKNLDVDGYEVVHDQLHAVGDFQNMVDDVRDLLLVELRLCELVDVVVYEVRMPLVELSAH